MTVEVHRQMASFIWEICNLLRGPYKRNEYRKVILPFTVLLGFNCILEPNKADAMAEYNRMKGKPEEDVNLQYYQTKQSYSGSVALEDDEPYGVKGITDVGTGNTNDEKKPLSEIINSLNSKFGTEFTEEDKLVFDQVEEKASNDERVIQTALATLSINSN